MAQPKILIDSVDYTSLVDLNSLRISKVMGSTINRCSFTIRDVDGTLPSSIKALDCVVEKSDDSDIRYFGGIVTSTSGSIEGVQRVLRTDCQDWTVLLAKAYAPSRLYRAAEYPTSKALIQEVFSKSFIDPLTQVDLSSEFDLSTYVEDGNGMPTITLNRQEITQFLDVLATRDAFEWYMDEFKKLHYFELVKNPAPFDLSDAPDGSATYAYSGFTVNNDIIGAANVILVVGAFAMSDDASKTYTGDGSTTEFEIDRTWFATEADAADVDISLHVPRVYRNDGTEGTPSWTQLTVFKEDDSNYSGGANECTWNALDKILVFGSAPPDLPNAFKIEGRYLSRAVAKLPAKESEQQVLGRWLWYKIIDPNIRTSEEAYRLAQREMVRRKFGITQYTCVVEQDGLDVGQRILLTNSIYSLSEEPLVIDRIEMRWPSPTLTRYTVSMRISFYQG